MAKVEQLSTAKEDSAAFADIKSQFDAFTRGELHPSKLIANLSEICRGHAEVTWDALSLIDQYHRRGLLSTGIFINAKTALNAVAFGAPRALDTKPLSEKIKSASQSASKVNPSAPSHAAASLQESATAKNNGDTAPNDSTALLTPSAIVNTPAFEIEKNSGDSSVTDALLPSTNVAKQTLRATDVLLDRYVLIEPIHATATATIFKAYDRKRSELSEVERFVSIKGLNAASASAPEVQALLKHEFSQSKDLSHPNILATYDYHADSEASFLVQALLEGQLLSRLIERLTPRSMLQAQALAIVREVGLALAYAHEKHIVHGALSADMIIVGSNGSIKVFGFGSDGTSPAGMSARATMDRSDDVFALACIAYEMLAGHAPFMFANQQRERRWTRIATLSRRQWRVLEAALQPQRARRPSNIRDWVMSLVEDDAATFLPSYEYIASELPPRRRWLPALGKFAAALLVVAVVAAGIYLLQTGAFKLPVRAASDVARSLMPPETKSSSPPATASSNKTIEAPAAKASTTTAKADAKKTRSHTARNAATSASSLDRANDAGAEVAVNRATQSPKVESSAEEEAPSSTASQVSVGPAEISFTTARFTVASNESVARVNVVRHGGATYPITLKWRTLPGSAKPDTDYAATRDGEIHIPAGERYAAILVPIVHGDARTQGSKWFDVELTDASNATLTATTTATVVIVGAE